MPESHPQHPHSSGRAGRPGGGDGAPGDGGALLLSGARLTDGRTVDVRLCDGRIEAVGTAGSLGPAPGTSRVDLDGYLLLPAPAEPHAHGDTALSAEHDGPLAYATDDPLDLDPRPNYSQSANRQSAKSAKSPLPDRRADEAADEPADGWADDPAAGPASRAVQRRATEAALLQLSHGATALRSHVRIGDVQGLGALGAVLQARRSLRGLVDLTAVAVPRLLTGAAGADGLAMLRDAVKMGACAVGGCPDTDPDPTGYVEAVLEIAEEHGCPVDLHTDGDDPARLSRLAAMAGGLRTGVTVGPCGGLGLLPTEVAARAADRLAAAEVAVVCLPQGACGGTDRRDTAPVRLLRAAGVRVAAGSGALRDLANPVGRGDPLESAYLLASRFGLRPEDAYDAVSASARAVLGLPEVRVEAGFPAELLAVRGERLSSVLSLGYSRIVVHRGRVVARTSAVREYCDSAATAAAALDLPRQGRPKGQTDNSS